MMKRFNWLHLLSALIGLKLLLHLYVNGLWSFHRDALLYLALGRHLDWGYASVPPAIGFWAWFGTNVLGGSVEGVRLIPTFFGAAIVLLTALMAREMLPRDYSGKYAILLVGLTGLLSGAFLRPCMLFQPVVFDIFYWTLLCWLFLKYINTQKPVWLLWFGVAAGLGLLNKYSVLIFLFAMLPGLLLSKTQRQIFTQKHLYIAAGIALLIVSPNIAWQVAHQLPVFRHLSELAATQFVHVTLGDFFADQLQFNVPALPIWISGLLFLLLHKQAGPWRIFGWMYLTVLAVLLFFSAKSYYSLGAYPVLVAAGAVYLEQITAARRRWVRYALPVYMLAAGLLGMPATLPVFPPEQEARYVQKMAAATGMDGLLRWEDGKRYALPQDFADMLGWEEIAGMAGRTWQNIPDKTTAAIYAENYGMAGAIEHFGKKYGVPEVLSFSDNYRYWLPDSLPAHFKTLIYVNDELGEDMPGFFEKIELVGRVDMPLSRQHGTLLYRCENPTPAFFERIGTAIRRAKAEQQID